jgi:hypothetical protein
MAIQDGPAILPGDTWYPRGQGLERTIVGRDAEADGQQMVRYRTRHGEFTAGEREFRFWIERLSASSPH